MAYYDVTGICWSNKQPVFNETLFDDNDRVEFPDELINEQGVVNTPHTVQTEAQLRRSEDLTGVFPHWDLVSLKQINATHVWNRVYCFIHYAAFL